MAPCLAPVILAGYLLTIQTSWHHTTNFDGQMLEAQTCETGAALNLRVAASGLEMTPPSPLQHHVVWLALQPPTYPRIILTSP
jgi:hypothetical protein